MAFSVFKYFRKWNKILVSACCIIVFFGYAIKSRLPQKRPSSSFIATSSSLVPSSLTEMATFARNGATHSNTTFDAILQGLRTSTETSHKWTLLDIIKSQDNPKQLLNFLDFEYKMNQPACGDNIVALIVVHSAPQNLKLRMILRSTWAQVALLKDTPLRVLFLLGDTTNKMIQTELDNENFMYGDLLQGNFIDKLRNQTYKHIMGFKWFIQHCSHAQVLIKVDDDSFLNTPELLLYLKHTINPLTGEVIKLKGPLRTFTKSDQKFIPFKHLFRHPENLIFCWKRSYSRPVRANNSKWYLSKKEYAPPYFPPHCKGYSIIYSMDVVLRLYNAAQSASIHLWMDDVFVTGFLTRETNIKITSAKSYFLDLSTFTKSFIGLIDLNKRKFLFAWQHMKGVQIFSLWEKIEKHKENIGSPLIRFLSNCVKYFFYIFLSILGLSCLKLLYQQIAIIKKN